MARSLCPLMRGGDQRGQRSQVGGEIHVHIGDHVGVGGQPDLLQGPPPTLLIHVDGVHLGEFCGEAFGHSPRLVGARVVGDGDAGGPRERVRQSCMEPVDRLRQILLLVVHRNDDLDHGRCGEPGTGVRGER